MEHILRQWYDNLEVGDESIIVLLSQATAKTGVGVLMSMNNVFGATWMGVQDMTDKLRETSIGSLPLVNLTSPADLATKMNNLLSLNSIVQAISSQEGSEVSLD